MSVGGARSEPQGNRLTVMLSATLRHLGQQFAMLGARAGRAGRYRSSRDDCIFCLQEDPDLNRIMCENRKFFARYDNFPANPGHVEIVPKRHVESFFDLSSREIAEAYALMREVREVLTSEFERPDGYTIGVNEGRAAGQSIGHLHVHLIPRYNGDVKDPRGGIRQAAPNCDPDSWLS